MQSDETIGCKLRWWNDADTGLVVVKDGVEARSVSVEEIFVAQRVVVARPLPLVA